MDLGVHVVRFDFAGAEIGPTLARIARTAESAGAVSLSVMDHYFQMDRSWPAELPMLEGYATLGFFAAHTSRVRLRLLVTGVTYRHPGLLAKIVATLDTLSEGRAELGIGAAWYEREHRGLGVPFPPLAERFAHLEEAIQICLQMWDPAQNGPYQGRHFRLEETLCSPLPRTRPPILIGGGGERKTLLLAARYADACNFFPSNPEEVAHKLEVLGGHCAREGRDPSAIRRTIIYRSPALAAGKVDEFVDELVPYARLGIDEVIVSPGIERPVEWIEEVCTPAVPRLAELGRG